VLELNVLETAIDVLMVSAFAVAQEVSALVQCHFALGTDHPPNATVILHHATIQTPYVTLKMVLVR
jgi:hypothetical protein